MITIRPAETDAERQAVYRLRYQVTVEELGLAMRHADHAAGTVRELLDDTGLAWAVSAVGDDLTETPVCAAALERGGHLHVGLEFYGGPGTPTNASLVASAVAACAAAGRPVATCNQAAEVLGLAVA